MERLTLQELIVRTRDGIRPMHHSQSTVWQYEYSWRKLCDYFSKHGVSSFSEKLAQQFIIEIRKQYETGAIKRWKFKLFRKATSLLGEYHQTGCVTWRHAPKWDSGGLKSASLITIMDDYTRYLKKQDYGGGTIGLYKTVCNQFLMYLEQESHHDLSQLTLRDVSRFIPFASALYQSTSMRTVLSSLRCFLRYADHMHLTHSDLAYAVPSSSARKTQTVPTITSEEEQRLLARIDRGTPVGMRNYAIVLLALRLGLRSIDIVQLKLENIKWGTNSIEITQQKTGRQLAIPLLADVGNALVDYLQNGRPTSQDSHVFLKSVAPYTPLSPTAGLYSLISNCMKYAEVRQAKDERRGPHVLRHSLAARLLIAETPLPVISGILGHADKDSTKIYLSTDLEHLRACALGTAGIEVSTEELK
ncbi:site-specific integrase [Alicyclobacillus sp. SO9]|uniref:site-specific integrase n=1 Tax=Alicyclobacillus sp. SO9 TaxID=2665646 RepID=UPI0018E86179|nr:site-specific integrase [Alicyclobacillus sp. SO9]QQE78437.1 tyrosine-type recombinase/integrase [Alicyclobacillus sp. SO9]